MVKRYEVAIFTMCVAARWREEVDQQAQKWRNRWGCCLLPGLDLAAWGPLRTRGLEPRDTLQTCFSRQPAGTGLGACGWRGKRPHQGSCPAQGERGGWRRRSLRTRAGSRQCAPGCAAVVYSKSLHHEGRINACVRLSVSPHAREASGSICIAPNWSASSKQHGGEPADASVCFTGISAGLRSSA